MEAILSWVLRTGTLSAAALMCIGFFLGSGLMWIGIILLMLTPLMRVIIAGLWFMSQRDLLFSVIALYVISILVMGSLLRL